MITPDPYVPDSGDLSYDVRHYDLELSYRVASNRLLATATVTAIAHQNLTEFALDLAGLTVTSVLIDDKKPRRYTHTRRRLRIWPAKAPRAGESFTVKVRYQGNPKPLRGAWGSVGWEELEDGVIVASQPNGAASWFPCNDRPSNKATYRISISTDSPYRVVSNGVPRSTRSRSSTTTWVFDQPEPMATYLASAQIGQYELREVAAAPVAQFVALPARLRRRFEYDFGRQTLMMQVFTRLFGAYPYARYTVVVTDDELEIPLEAQGMSIFGSNFLDGERGHERLVAHELAHQWFGNSLTVASWSHIWLNEGFACYSEWLFSEFSGGAAAQKLALRHYERLARLPQDLIIADPGPELMFDDRLYKRGALTLHALRRRMGDDDFFAMLLSWTTGHTHRSVTTNDFIAHVAETGLKDAGKFFDGWLYSSKLPPL